MRKWSEWNEVNEMKIFEQHIIIIIIIIKTILNIQCKNQSCQKCCVHLKQKPYQQPLNRSTYGPATTWLTHIQLRRTHSVHVQTCFPGGPMTDEYSQRGLRPLNSLHWRRPHHPHTHTLTQPHTHTHWPPHTSLKTPISFHVTSSLHSKHLMTVN